MHRWLGLALITLTGHVGAMVFEAGLLCLTIVGIYGALKSNRGSTQTLQKMPPAPPNDLEPQTDWDFLIPTVELEPERGERSEIEEPWICDPVIAEMIERQVRVRTASLVAINTVLQMKLAEFEQREAALKGTESLFKQIIVENTDAILLINREGNVQFVNPAAENLFGRDADDLKELDFGIPLNVINSHEIQILRQTHRGVALVNVEMRVVQTFWENEPIFLAYLRDITERKRSEKQLVYAASHDSLTGLPNRACFMEQLQTAMAQAQSNPSYVFAVLFLDIDGFKQVNDSLGHGFGDQLLIEIAQRLLHCLRPTDKIARMGGDEFAIILDNIQHPYDAISVAERIQLALTDPILLGDRPICPTASIGIAISSAEVNHPDALLRDADTAMYQAKRSGHGCYKVFNTSMHACVLLKLQVGLDLRQAIENEELRLHYQPIVNLKTGQICGFEALARWYHPERGVILPTEFIPLAETTGLIVPLGTWALEEACRQMRTWQQGIPAARNLSVSVNLSTRQLIEPDFLDTVDRVLESTGLAASCLMLEITEGVMVENSSVAEELLYKLNARQVQISIDDFGTGYSCLSYLHRLPITVLKLDGSFVRGVNTQQDTVEIIRAIMSMAQAMEVRVIAEGIETSEHCLNLKRLRCDYGQGFLFAPALDNEMAESLLSTGIPSFLEEFAQR